MFSYDQAGVKALLVIHMHVMTTYLNTQSLTSDSLVCEPLNSLLRIGVMAASCAATRRELLIKYESVPTADWRPRDG